SHTTALGSTANITFPGSGSSSAQWSEFRIWNSARTASHIEDNFSSRLTGSESNLVLYYNFDMPNGSTTVTDLSPTNRDATFLNVDYNTIWVDGADSTFLARISENAQYGDTIGYAIGYTPDGGDF